jgi:hypothetical protein
MKNKLLLVCIIIIIINIKFSYSQASAFYFTPPVEFKYNNKKYIANPKGLQAFLDETTMDDEVKFELNNKLQVIKNKKKTAMIVGFTLAGAGLGYLLYANSKNDKNERGLKSSDALTGFGLVVSGMAFDLIFGNKRKDYYNFLETYNKKSYNNPIIISLKVDYTTQLNTGIVLNF